MRVAVFSDVQANLPALQTVVDDILRWDPDLVVMDGDLVNRGPNSLGCLLAFERLRQDRNWLAVRGNHEDYVLHCRATAAPSAAERGLRRFTDWTVRQLAAKAQLLESWPDHLTFSGPAHRHWVHVTHGTLLGNRDGVTADRPDSDLVDRLPDDVALFVTAHTHRPLQRRFGELAILNVGSVGAPFDGDVRASYARLEYRRQAWHTQVVRLAYDRRATDREFHDSGFLDQGGPLARIIYEEWRRATLMIGPWNRRYRPAVMAGELTLDQAVADFLARLD
jgi:predicted phosphodiesterase